MSIIKKDYLTERNYVIVASVSAFALSGLTKLLIKKVYTKTTGGKPPQNPTAEQSSLKKVVVFSFTTALVTATVKMVGRHLLAKQWKAVNGKLPDHLS